MASIRILTENVASKIAAGEVVERPASVVRELMDNSIDARSDRVFVKISKGGKDLIRVSDNGAGMNRDDLLLCVESHATSKIREASDLLTVETLGFRGEALPSIASVSRMEITSRPMDQLVGYRLRLAGGRMKSIDETGSPAGTVIAVRNLFYNLPARKKFLRTIRTETDQITEAFSKISLPFIGTHFRLEEGDRTILNLPGSENYLNRLSVLLGRKIASTMRQVSHDSEGMRLKAFLGAPDQSRARGDRILVYVNNRNVRDRMITRAVMEGYGQRLMKGRYPQVALLVEIDPSLVDVNVHPTKQEIRFRNAPSLYQHLVSLIGRSFEKKVHPVSETVISRKEGTDGQAPPFAGMPLAEPLGRYAGAGQETAPGEVGVPSIQRGFLENRPRIIGQLKNTYILCETEEGFLMVDQHAAHERIVYERLKKAFLESGIESQAFLIPPRLEVSVKDRSILLKRIEPLRELGFEIEYFGGNTFLVRTVPSLLTDLQWEQFLQDFIPIIGEEGDLTQGPALESLLATMACHGAIRAGKKMSQQEMDLLLKQLELTDVPTNCPHGRPVSRAFSTLEIEKMFKRVV